MHRESLEYQDFAAVRELRQRGKRLCFRGTPRFARTSLGRGNSATGRHCRTTVSGSNRGRAGNKSRAEIRSSHRTEIRRVNQLAPPKKWRRRKAGAAEKMVPENGVNGGRTVCSRVPGCAGGCGRFLRKGSR